ncbi:MAG: phage holin family protein [Chloroflexota bacterium]|nr:phage holin family protein [Chloroflexota bacterium]
MTYSRDDRPLSELFSDLVQETGTLVRQEVQLAKAEVTQSATQAGRAAGFMAAGGLVAYAGLLAIIAGVILWLWRNGMSDWTAALVVGVVVVLIGVVLLMRGRAMLQTENLAPQRTVESLRADTAMVKEQVS